MRIISKFQDYYDSALAYGFENDRVLVRHNQSWDVRGEGTPKAETPSELLKKLQALTKQVATFSAFGSSNPYEKRLRNSHMQITPVCFCVGGRVTKALWVLDVRRVFPTFAGVFPYGQDLRRERSRLPHVRGGVSLKVQQLEDFCTVFHTLVGVFLLKGPVVTGSASLPHVGGGVSDHAHILFTTRKSSPCSWGCLY